MKLLSSGACWASTILIAATAHAVSLTIANPSFESGIANWVANPTGGIPDVSSYQPASPPDGVNVAYVYSNEPLEHTLSQTLSNTAANKLSTNTTYTLQVEVGNPGWFGTPMEYRVDLLAGSNVLASDNNRLSIAPGQWQTSKVAYTPNSGDSNLGQLLGIRLVNLANNNEDEVDFDKVRLNTSPAVPGDYNSNGVVDAADYAIWTTHRGTTGPPTPGVAQGNGNGDSTVDAADYQIWLASFRASPGVGSSADQEQVAVPEPGACGLIAILALCMSARRNRIKRDTHDQE